MISYHSSILPASKMIGRRAAHHLNRTLLASTSRMPSLTLILRAICRDRALTYTRVYTRAYKRTSTMWRHLSTKFSQSLWKWYLHSRIILKISLKIPSLSSAHNSHLMAVRMLPTTRWYPQHLRRRVLIKYSGIIIDKNKWVTSRQTCSNCHLRMLTTAATRTTE